MHPALTFQFERAVNEYAQWQAVPAEDRPDAPAWWWDTALAAVDEAATMPVEWCATLGVADESTYAKGAEVFRNASDMCPNSLHARRSRRLGDMVGEHRPALWSSAEFVATKFVRKKLNPFSFGGLNVGAKRPGQRYIYSRVNRNSSVVDWNV
jgi:hypothetical protein